MICGVCDKPSRLEDRITGEFAEARSRFGSWGRGRISIFGRPRDALRSR
jgi:hypothetical protein